MGDDLTAEEIAAIVERARADSLVRCRENRAAEERRYAETRAWKPAPPLPKLSKSFYEVRVYADRSSTSVGAHTGWSLTGTRVPDFPDADHQDGLWLDVRDALAADVDYVEILADAPNLSSPWAFTNRLKAAA